MSDMKLNKISKIFFYLSLIFLFTFLLEMIILSNISIKDHYFVVHFYIYVISITLAPIMFTLGFCIDILSLKRKRIKDLNISITVIIALLIFYLIFMFFGIINIVYGISYGGFIFLTFGGCFLTLGLFPFLDGIRDFKRMKLNKRSKRFFYLFFLFLFIFLSDILIFMFFISMKDYYLIYAFIIVLCMTLMPIMFTLGMWSIKVIHIPKTEIINELILSLILIFIGILFIVYGNFSGLISFFLLNWSLFIFGITFFLDGIRNLKMFNEREEKAIKIRQETNVIWKE